MTVTRHNIPGQQPPPMSCHATAARGTIVHISGLVGSDATGAIVEGGLAAQAEQAILNVLTALGSAGASADDLVKTTFYVVDWDPSKMEALAIGGMAAQAKVPFPDAALTLIGVQSLFSPEMLIEIEAVAVVGD